MHQKGALKAAKTEALEKGKERAEPHFLVETHGRPPSKLPSGQTRQEKFTGSAHHVRCIEILKSSFSNEYGYSLGTFVHHYKNCYGQLKAATVAQGMRVHYVRSAVHGGSPCVPSVSRSCCVRPIRGARRLRIKPWRPSCRLARISCPALRQDLGLAATMLSRAEPRTIQAVPSCGRKNCSSVTKAVEHFQTLYPTAGAKGAAKSILCRIADCVSGCVEAGELETEDPKSKHGGIPLARLSGREARGVLGTGSRPRGPRSEMSDVSSFHVKDVMNMDQDQMIWKYHRTVRTAGLLRYMLKADHGLTEEPEQKTWRLFRQSEFREFQAWKRHKVWSSLRY